MVMGQTLGLGVATKINRMNFRLLLLSAVCWADYTDTERASTVQTLNVNYGNLHAAVV
jgi:hypothetical protein